MILLRLKRLDEELLERAMKDREELVRVHAFRALAEFERTPNSAPRWLRKGLHDESAMVQRAAALAAADHPDASLIVPLIDLHDRTPDADSFLKHASRMALKSHLADPDRFRAALPSLEKHIDLVAGVCLALKNEQAGDFIAKHVKRLAESGQPEKLSTYLRFAAANASATALQNVALAARERYRDDLTLQLQLLDAIQSGLQQSGGEAPPVVRNWALELARSLLQLDDESPGSLSWRFVPLPNAKNATNPWQLSRRRNSADGMKETPLFSSFPTGEQSTGAYRSQPFVLGETLSFYLAGHDGFPRMPLQGRNFVALRLAGTHQIIHKTPPPRNDTAQRVRWDTSRWKGQEAYVELVDGDANSAFAWLAAGRFSETRLNPSERVANRRRGTDLVAKFRLQELKTPLAKLARAPRTNQATRTAICAAFVAFRPDSRMAALAQAQAVTGLTPKKRVAAREAVLRDDPDGAIDVIAEAIAVASSSQQASLAEALATDLEGARLLLGYMESGRAAPRLLRRPTLVQKLLALGERDSELIERGKRILETLPNQNEELVKLISNRAQHYRSGSGSVEAGRLLFEKNCSACHQVAGKGAKVGPNLDGIGNRGLNRLVEDVLAPNWNVDAAFRSTVIVTIDGKVTSGFLKDDRGDRALLIDGKGKEIAIPKSSIDEQKKTQFSPMPANMSEALTPDQFRDLLAYLLDLRR